MSEKRDYGTKDHPMTRKEFADQKHRQRMGKDGSAVSEKTVLRKQCDCHPATASGPRVVVTGEIEGREMHLRATLSLAKMACDECNTPWAPPDSENKPEPPEGEETPDQ